MTISAEQILLRWRPALRQTGGLLTQPFSAQVCQYLLDHQRSQARLSSKSTDNLDAYLEYLKGHEHLHRFNKDDNLVARQMAEESMALDPDYPYSYLLLGKTPLLSHK